MPMHSFISHRLYVAALGSGTKTVSPARFAPEELSRPTLGEVFRSTLSPEELSALVVQHWLDFPFARNQEQSTG